MQIGDSVQLEYDPSRQGVIVKGPRPVQLGDTKYTKWRVQWNDGMLGWHPEYELCPAPEAPPDAFDLLEEGRFCGHRELRRNIAFCQIAGNVSDLVYSMDATNIDFLPYQYKPVLTFLASPSNGVLIADEVGLGKTIEAGLIWTELRARSDARRLVVVCPATLRDKWEIELEAKFGVSTRQVDAEGLLKELSAPKYLAAESQALVCSIQGIRPPKQYEDPAVSSHSARLARFLEERDGRGSIIDLLVVDEAHHLRNPGTQSARIGTLLRDASEHVVLLSATPLNNKEDDLFHLLRLVDPDTFSSSDFFPKVLAANEPLVLARRLVMAGQSRAKVVEALRLAGQHELLRGNRRLKGIIDSVDEESLTDPASRVELASRIDNTNLLRYVFSRTRKREVQELRVDREARRPEVKMPPGGVEEEFYRRVTTSIRRYAIDKDVGAGFLLATPQRLMSSCMYAAAKTWSSDLSDDEVAQLADEADGGEAIKPHESDRPLMAHIAADLRGFDYHLLRDADTKFTMFCDWLLKYMKKYPDEKVIVFSYFKATLAYLSERLAEHAVKSQVLHGGLAENKQHAIDRFRHAVATRVLLTSEVASEGVDLQFSRCIVNYDLPWNPMRIEQRIGRIDRIGQQSPKVQIVNMVYGDTIDDRIYTVLLEKIGIFKRSIGGMEPILGEMVRDLTGDLLRQELTKEQEEERIEQTAIAVANHRRQQDVLEGQAIHLVALEDYVLRQVKEAHDFKRRITSHDLKAYAGDYLTRHAGEPFDFREDPREPLCVEIALPPKLRVRLAEYIRDERLPAVTSLTEGRRRQYVFSHKIGRPSQRRERITQFHPFIRFIGSQLKPSSGEFCPLVALELPSGHIGDRWQAGDYAFAFRRWRFGGGRPVEELRARSVHMSDEDVLPASRSWELVSAGKQHGMDWHSARLDVDGNRTGKAINRCQAKLDEDFNRARLDRKNGNDDRIDLQVKTLERRATRQLTRLHDVVQQHREHGRKGLVRATEGRIREIGLRRDTEVAQRELKRKFTSRQDELYAGVIRVKARGGE